MMFERHRLEKDGGDDDAVKRTPAHRALSKKFGVLHGLSSLANLAALVAVHVYAWHLSASIGVSS